MRKLLAVIIAIFFVCVSSVVCAEGIDISALTTAELKELIVSIQKEIDNREDATLSDQSYTLPCEILNVDGYRLEILRVGELSYDGTLILQFDVLAENTSPYDIEIDLSFVSIDDWDVRDSMVSEGIKVSSGKKSSGEMMFVCFGIEKASINDIESFEFEVSVWDKGRSLYNLYRTETLKGKFA